MAASCACFTVLLAPTTTAITSLVFAGTVLLACVEKLAATANCVAVERDWVS